MSANDIGPWIVRVTSNKIGVGIFACAEEELPKYVDEFADVDECEYARLPHGGIRLGDDVIPYPEHGISQEGTGNPVADDLTQSWHCVITDGTIVPVWLPLMALAGITFAT